MEILVIEDDKKTAAFLRRGLTEAGYTVEVEHDGKEGLWLAKIGDHDLIILDILLPGMDGREIMEEIRKQDSQTPVIFLTALDQVSDRVKGLELGADDYLVKPFAFSELLARVRTLFRRTTPSEGNVFKIQDLKIDPVVHKVTRGDQKIELTSQEFNLLLLLARYEGQVLTRTQIMQKIWEIDFEPNTNVVDVAVRRLRMKVDDPFETKLIHTVRGVGYVLEKRA